jgi:hypothetical protein
MTVNDVAVSFGVHPTNIWSLAQRFRTTDAVRIGQDPLEKNVTSGRDRFNDCGQSTESNSSPHIRANSPQ